MNKVILGEITEESLRHVASLNQGEYTHILLTEEELTYLSVFSPSKELMLDGEVFESPGSVKKEAIGNISIIIQDIDSIIARSTLNERKLQKMEDFLNGGKKNLNEPLESYIDEDLFIWAMALKQQTLRFAKRNIRLRDASTTLESEVSINFKPLVPFLGNLTRIIEYPALLHGGVDFIRLFLFYDLDLNTLKALGGIGRRLIGDAHYSFIKESDLDVYAAICPDFNIASNCGTIAYPLGTKIEVPNVRQQTTIERMLYSNVKNARRLRGGVLNGLGSDFGGKRYVTIHVAHQFLGVVHSIEQYDAGRIIGWNHVPKMHQDIDLKSYSEKPSNEEIAASFIEANIVLSRRIGKHVRHQIEKGTTLGIMYDAVLRKLNT